MASKEPKKVPPNGGWLDTYSNRAALIEKDPAKRKSHILGLWLGDIHLIELDGDRICVSPPSAELSTHTIICRIGYLDIRIYTCGELDEFAYRIGAVYSLGMYVTKGEVVLRIQEHLLLASSSYLFLHEARAVSDTLQTVAEVFSSS